MLAGATTSTGIKPIHYALYLRYTPALRALNHARSP